MKKELTLLGLFTAIFLLVYIAAFDAKLDLNGDNANYIRFAQNIANGNGYTNGTIDGYVPTNHYPPGYSAFLAILFTLGIKSLVVLKSFNGLFLYLSLIGLGALLYKRTKNAILTTSVLILTTFTPQLQHFANIVMSEMLYLLTIVISIVSLYLYDKKNIEFYKSPYFYSAIIAASAAYYTRTVGASIIFGLIIFFLFRKDWLASISAAAVTILINIPWTIRNSYAEIESRYLGTIMTVNPWRPEEGTISTFVEMMEKMIINIDDTIIKGFKEMLFPFINISNEPSSLLAVIGGLIIVAVIFYGAYNFNKLRWLLIAFLIANIGLFALWHGGNGSRYVVPIAPFLFVLFYFGVYHIISIINLKAAKIASFAIIIVFLPMLKPLKAQCAMAKMPYPQQYINYFEAAKTLEKEAEKPVVVCCRKPELFMYYAPSIFAVNYKYTLDDKELLADLEQKKVTYVVLDQLGFSSTNRYLFPAIINNEDRFTYIGTIPNPDTYLFIFEKEEIVN